MDVTPHIPMLRDLAHRHVITKIDFVASVSKEAERLGTQQEKPNLLGICLCNRTTGIPLILIALTISRNERDSVISGMYARRSKREDMDLLVEDTSFLKHLVLHECAHATSDSFSELECDDWAFERLRSET
jgi:hypothetical protein